MNVLHETLFPFEELIDFSLYESLQKIFDQINYYPLEQLAHWGPGRKGHSKTAMLKAFIAKQALEIKTFTGLLQMLRRDLVLRLLCGFTLSSSLPALSTFSRFFAALARNPTIYNAIYDQALVE